MNSDRFVSVSRFTLLLFIISVSSIQAQPSPPPDEYPYARFSPSMAIIIVVLVAALFFMGFFSIYIRRCSNDGGASVRAALSMRRAGRLAAASRGLDSEVLETFPTFSYSAVKGLKIGKGALECAVCLNEFEDEETIRLIPKCDHVFHVECIDAWLENHVTCPVCRSDLATKLGGESTQPESVPEVESTPEEGNTEVVIRVEDEIPVLKRNQSEKPNLQPRSKSVRGPGLFNKFRSHSTGHSLVQPGENIERFTLRLPDNVRKEMISKALLNRCGSTVRMTGEGSSRKGYRTGEGSTKERSYGRNGSVDRWVFSKAPSFLSRAFSIRSQKMDNGGPSTSSTTIDELPLNNIGPKSHEPDSGRAPV